MPSTSIKYRYSDRLLGWLNPELLGVTTAIAAFSILPVIFGAKMPIWIHIAWAGEYGAAISHDPAVGIAFALSTALLAECIARKFLMPGATHIDPPAGALAILSPVYPIVLLLNQSHGINMFAMGLAVLVFGVGYLAFWREDLSIAYAERME